ncbi:MAG: DUF2238 domain-containing protein [Syntrophobacteraceae bacterium]
MKAKEPLLLLIVGAAALIVSAINPHDYPTWLMEVFPIFLGVPILIAVYTRFRMTPLAYRLVFAHSLILMLGAHYTYAEVPLGFWAQELFHLGRNHYDRLGHLAQGFIPALLAREVLLRCTPLRRGGWLFFIVTCVCLAISAFYEFIEWWAALMLGQGADAFLGSQGDPWDTQWDMFLALVGAMAGQILLGRQQDRAIKDKETR